MNSTDTAAETPLALAMAEKPFPKGYVAKALGCDYARLALLRQGLREMTATEIAKAAALFEKPLEYFIPQEVA